MLGLVGEGGRGEEGRGGGRGKGEGRGKKRKKGMNAKLYQGLPLVCDKLV